MELVLLSHPGIPERDVPGMSQPLRHQDAVLSMFPLEQPSKGATGQMEQRAPHFQARQALLL